MKYKVDTKIDENAFICQTVSYEFEGEFDGQFNGIVEQATQNIIDTKEEQFKKVLIKLGWVPLKDDRENIKEIVADALEDTFSWAYSSGNGKIKCDEAAEVILQAIEQGEGEQ